MAYEFKQYLLHEAGYCSNDFLAIALGATMAIPLVVGLSRLLRSEGRDLASVFLALRAIREMRRESRRASANNFRAREQI